MIARRVLLAAGASLIARPAFAIDEGVAQGRYNDEGVDFKVTHAIALAIDNAEGFDDREKGLRVLLSDRKVPVSALCGIAFPPVWGLAREGKLEGLLLNFDPADRTSLVATILTKPEPGYSMATTTISNSEGLWKRLEANPTRVVGELNADASERMVFEFSAPVFTNAVEADLKGPAAAASEPVKVLLARAEAIGRADWKAAAALSTEDGARNFDAVPPEILKQAPKMAAQMVRQLRAAQRVVIRRETAAVMLGKGEWASVARVDGVWKASD
ncbi:hypothetical protein [Phenylobacterium sp.]|uniref:hypothetical protein n=1 Tax=Phenylobacterium sp. TaxID=1871053 RepID=UPI002EDA72D2